MTPDTSAKTPVREIKFRCWSKNRKEMEYDCGHKVDPDLYQLMQYTGLKDKAGKEVYEGDVVSVFASDNNDKYFWHEVVYQKGAFGYVTLKEFKVFISFAGNQNFDWINGNCSPDIEVLGNIYSNPELLPSK